MRAVIQRVKSAGVYINNDVHAAIAGGLLVLLGVEQGDNDLDAHYIAEKTTGLRIFDDEAGKMNLSVKDSGGSILIVSQFTLLGDVRKGRRPSFSQSADWESATRLYELTADIMARDIFVKRGVFGADMQVELINDGPVTILLDSKRLF